MNKNIPTSKKQKKQTKQNQQPIKSAPAHGSLYIDSTEFGSVTFAFVPDDELHPVITKEYAVTRQPANITALFQKFSARSVKKDLSRITAFVVRTGGGSFAGLRSAIAFCKGMALVLDIPIYTVDDKQSLKLLKDGGTLDYGNEPNIGVTKPKVLKQIHTK